jgi:ABC-2 type transport system ATP-binding protein
MNDDVAIKVDKVYKNFILPHERTGSVKGVFTSMFSRATKKKETLNALKDISFEVKKGEFFGIVGRNGSGKSTLLKILAGIYQPTKGSTKVTGKLVPFIELGVGFNPELSGRDNVYLNGAMLGFSVKQIEAIYDEIVAFAELERFMDQKLKNYSSGMQVRLAFSMATHAEADILLVDEVLAVGDADFQRKCFDYFKELKKNKKTIIFVSHNMDSIKEYCDAAILIEDSKLIASGRADKVATKYSRMFIDEAFSKDNVEESDRWGDGKATIVSVKASPLKITDKNENFQINVSVKANEQIENLLVGFDIKNRSGVAVVGTNTKIQNQEIGILNKGEVRNISFEIPNIFADGHYTMSVAAVAENGTPCDWWDEAVTFDVYEDQPLWFLTSPKIETKVTK